MVQNIRGTKHHGFCGCFLSHKCFPANFFVQAAGLQDKDFNETVSTNAHKMIKLQNFGPRMFLIVWYTYLFGVKFLLHLSGQTKYCVIDNDLTLWLTTYNKLSKNYQ